MRALRAPALRSSIEVTFASSRSISAASSARMPSRPRPVRTVAPAVDVSSDRGNATRSSTYCDGGMFAAYSVGVTPSAENSVNPCTEEGCPHTRTSPAAAEPGSRITASI